MKDPLKPLAMTALVLSFCMTASHAQSILLGGYDGTQTQNTIAPATIFSSTGVRELTGAKQDAGASGAVSTRIWTDQTTNKELQWSPTQTSTSTGNWGVTDFTTDASTASDSWVVTQQNASWINFEIANTGTADVTLDKFHISANRTGSGAPTTLTISLQQNGTFANPPVISASDLTATGTQDIALSASTGWSDYEFALSGMLSDLTLAAGEKATFRIANNTGTARLYLDNIAISGSVISDPAGPVDRAVSTVAASPSSVPANGSTTSTIMVTLKDASSKPVPGKSVTLAGGTGNATITPAGAQTTDASGQVTFTVSSNTVETEVFTATDTTDSPTLVVIDQTASVIFQTVPVAEPVDAGKSTVVASPTSVPADGSSTSTITVTLKDASGLLVVGEDVTLANTSGAGTPTISPSGSQTTNGNGQASFTVSSSTAGTEVFTATAITDTVVITQTASVTFTEVGASLLVSLLSDPVSASTSATESGAVEKFYDGTETLDDLGTTSNRGGSFVASGVDSDGVAGTNAHTVVYDMGTVVSFDGFVHAQRKGDGFDDVASIDFWVTNTDPGDAATTIPLPIFASQPTPDDSVALERNSAVLTEYLLPGGTISGRYVVMRLHTARTSGANPGGYTLLLGQTASVSDYDTWGSAYSGIGLPSEDDDLDGLSNEKERLFGLNPQDPTSANPFKAAFDTAAGTFSFTRRTQALTGMTYKIWYSTDLSEWFWESGASESVGAPVAEVETVAVTIDPDLLNEPKLFLRLSAEDLGPPPAITSLWGSNSTVTINFSEAMDDSSATNPANYIIEEDGSGSVSVSSAALSGDGRTVTLTLASALGIDSAFTVTTNRIANGAGQPLGNGTAGQFRTWDNDPTGIKVFILAGQSNMVGYGHSELGKDNVAGAVGSLRYLANNDATYPEYDYTSLLETPGDPAGSVWATRSDVKVWWRNGASGNLGGAIGKGELGPPFRGANTNWFGPEYGFGQVIGDHYASDDVLIIKAAWGGHKLVTDFRSPSAVAKRGGEVGASYNAIFNDAREVLLDLDNQFPKWAGRGYQIVGFAWHQGTSDKAPEAVANEYKDNLPDFIGDIRSEFAKPELPFVIATAGMQTNGQVEPAPYTGYTEVERAQLWVAGVAQPANMLSTDTRGFHEEASVSPSTQSFHWNHNARSYFRIGLGLGTNMVTLLDE